VTFKQMIDPSSLAVGAGGTVAILKSSQVAGGIFAASTIRRNLIRNSDPLGDGSGGCGVVETNWGPCNYGGSSVSYATASVVSPRGVSEAVGAITSKTEKSGDYRLSPRATTTGIADTRGLTLTFSFSAKTAGTGASFVVASLARYSDKEQGSARCDINGATWTRCSITKTFSSDSYADNSELRLYITGFTSGITVYVYGAKLEVGSQASNYQSDKEVVPASGSSLTSSDIEVASAGDGKTFVFMQKNCPPTCFGSPSENVFYTVALRGGSDGVKKANGSAAFDGAFSSGYLWEFQVSTTLDTTPPRVTYALPADKEKDVARNSIVQVNFDEAVDPVSLYSGLSVMSGKDPLTGAQLFGNAYRSLEFRTDDPCGINSCGETVYCLPKNQTIAVTVKADDLSQTPPLGKFPPNGVTDMCGNSLDGDADGTAEGGPTDDYAFSFSTNDLIDLVPPKVVSQKPAILTGNIPRDAAIDATFSKLMSATSVTTDTTRLLSPPANAAPTNFSVTSGSLSSAMGGKLDRTKVTFSHDLLSAKSPLYSADMNSGLRDLQQNCFYPSGGQTACTGNEPYCCNGKPFASAIAAAKSCGFTP
jgi:hypothetical protein